MPAPTFEEIVRELIAIKGQGTVADQIGKDPTQFCRAVSGQGGGFKIEEIDGLLTLAEHEIAPKGYRLYYMRLMWAFIEYISHFKEIIGEERLEEALK